jgi:hypothetical protein
MIMAYGCEGTGTALSLPGVTILQRSFEADGGFVASILKLKERRRLSHP